MTDYAVGIDLGTSHTVVASAPLAGAATDIALLPIPQRSTAGEVIAQPLLPSARYQAAPGELGEAWRQPWAPQGASDTAPAVIGRWARDLGAAVPGRLVASAKSWLSHTGVDRTAAILPWGAADDVAKVSPLVASASYLAHVKSAWDDQHPEAPLQHQTVVLTVPASFDEGARALTLEAAQLAGLPQVHLLEEPKAAFHDWLVLQGDQLAAQLADSRLVLVVDMGGGTSDFTLIRVDAAPDGGLPTLTRTAVGEHLMLGGDNMDLALAHQIEPAFTGNFAGDGHKLPATRFAQLVQRCRIAKEQLLAADAPAQVTITLLGGGSQLLARTVSVALTREQVQQSVVEGFWPLADIADTPRKRQGALRGLGLPYPADAAVSRHLAQFLAQHADGALPDTVLLNGGVFHAHALVQRLTQQLSDWRGAPVRVLHNPHPDWAVARGAAAYGLARHQAQAPADSKPNQPLAHDQRAPAAIKNRVPQIGGGSARSYWLLLPSPPGQPPQGLCLLPKGTPEGVRIVLTGRRFALRLGQAVRFNVLANSLGSAPAQAGQLAPLQGDGWVELPPLATVLPAPQGQATAQVEVQLLACMTEIGTLEVRCTRVQGGMVDAAQSWLLPFAVRGAVDSSKNIAASARLERDSDRKLSESKDSQALAAINLIDRIFGPQAQAVDAKEVRQLRHALEKLLGPREGWDVALLRALFDALLARAKRRRRTAEHERTWLNLAGWCLRPGLGAELDAWRMAQIWALYPQGLGHGKEPANWTEWWVFWRRVAAGLNADQQMELLEDVAGHMQKAVQQTARSAGKSSHGSYDDMLRLFAAMEAVPWQYRQEMGQWMLQRLQREGESVQTWWAIGRLAARQSLAANAHRVMPPDAAQEFLNATLAQDWRKNETAMFAAVQMARMTGDRARDLPDDLRAQVLDKMRTSGAPGRWVAMVERVVQMQAEDQKRSLGDSLPPGLVLL